MVRKITCIFIFFVLISLKLHSQPGIFGKLPIDTAIWTPTAYLSFIPDLENLYTISNEIIIDRVDITDSGSFVFDTKYLPVEDVLLRIHISKKGDLPASLIIGGKDENHFFLVANRNSGITIKSSTDSEFIKDIIIQGYSPNQTLLQINKIASFIDTVSINDPIIKKEFIKSAVFEKLRFIADTCTNPLVSLYALYKSKFDGNYLVNQKFYKNFLTKWEDQKSEYFNRFREKLPSSRKKDLGFIIFIVILSLSIGFLASLIYLKFFRKNQNLIQNLSVQERKIFALLIEGKSNKEISEFLSIGLNTVKTHVNSIYSKLDVKSRKDIMNLDLDNRQDR
jgi:DNA-binding CsgD family transcriptional regulator